jgi:hypothetical protein
VIEGNENQPNVVFIHNATSNPFDGVTPTLITNDNDWTQDIVVADMDNDGDLDIFISGTSDNGRIAAIFRNTDGHFNEDSSIQLTGVSQSTVAFGRL